MPKVYQNFLLNGVRPSLYLRPWLFTCFARYLPFETATRLFDVYVLEGDSFLFRTALALLSTLEARLFTPDLEELSGVFAGTDRGAMAILNRDNHGEVGEAGIDEVYEAMGATEDSLFETLETLEWKKDTWDRLVERELPD